MLSCPTLSVGWLLHRLNCVHPVLACGHRHSTALTGHDLTMEISFKLENQVLGHYLDESCLFCFSWPWSIHWPRLVLDQPNDLHTVWVASIMDLFDRCLR